MCYLTHSPNSAGCCEFADKNRCVESAEWLIAHGVTVQEWISVKERLPQEDEPVGIICEQVQVLLSDGFVTTGWCNRSHKAWYYLPYGDTHFLGDGYKNTPVIAWQPLAQPPKGERIKNG